MSGIKLSKVIFLTAIVASALVTIPGCMNSRNENSDVSFVGATEESISLEKSTTPETIGLESDLVLNYEVKDLEKNQSYPVCDFELVQNETVVTIYNCQWDRMSNLRIGVKGQNGVETSLDASNGSLTNVVPYFEYLPSGEYTLYVENIGDDKISSVSLCYSID